MDKIEKIRQAIERLKAENNNIRCNSNKAYCQGYGDGFVDLLSFLDTLSEEPVADDLEEEVKNYFQGYWPGTETAEQCNTDLHFTPLAILRFACHFAQWGAEHSGSSEIPNDHDGIDKKAGKRLRRVCNLAEDLKEDRLLEERLQELKEIRAKKDLDEASGEYAFNNTEDGGEVLPRRLGFIAGAKWQKEQDDKLVDIIYQQGIEKGKDEMMELIKKEKENE